MHEGGLAETRSAFQKGVAAGHQTQQQMLTYFTLSQVLGFQVLAEGGDGASKGIDLLFSGFQIGHWRDAVMGEGRRLRAF